MISAREPKLRVFVSSMMNRSHSQWRKAAREALSKYDFVHRPWLFEDAPASPEPVPEYCDRNVEQSDLVVWLSRGTTSSAVVAELRCALRTNKDCLVFQLPPTGHDEATASLLHEMQRRHKYRTVSTISELRRELASAFEDWLVTRARRGASLRRSEILERMLAESSGRTIARWQSLGLSRSEAQALADEIDKPSSTDALWPSDDQQFVILHGQLGSGKSLVCERFLQSCIRSALESRDSPPAVYLDWGNQWTSLHEEVSAQARQVGIGDREAVRVILDSDMTTSPERLRSVVNQVRAMLSVRPGSQVLLAAAGFGLSDAPESRPVPPLDDAAALALVDRVARASLAQSVSFLLPISEREALRVPIYAILLGLYLRDHPIPARYPIGEILANLVERGLKTSPMKPADVNDALKDLARAAMDSPDGWIHVGDGPRRDMLAPLLDAGLVVRTGSRLGFALPALRSWYAACYLEEHPDFLQGIVSDARRLAAWLPALSQFLAVTGNAGASRLLSQVAPRSPGYASLLLQASISRWAEGGQAPLPDFRTCGEAMRHAMTKWAEGLAALAPMVTPQRADGTMASIAVRSDESRLMYKWLPDDAAEPVLPLPNDNRTGSPTPSDKPGWEWRVTYDSIACELRKLLRTRGIPVLDGPIAAEGAWEATRILKERQHGYVISIPIAAIEKRLATVPEHATLYKGHPHALAQLRAEVARARQEGRDELIHPWGRDELVDPWGRYSVLNRKDILWGWFTEKGLVDYTTQVFTAALNAYASVVREWFPNFTEPFGGELSQPAHLVGVIILPEDDSRISAPCLQWYVHPTPDLTNWRATFAVGERVNTCRELLGQVRESHATTAALSPDDIPVDWWPAGDATFIYGNRRPVTCLVYDWLWMALRDVKWLSGAPPWHDPYTGTPSITWTSTAAELDEWLTNRQAEASTHDG